MMDRLRIDRLELRLRGAPAGQALQLAGELRRTLLPALDDELGSHGAGRARPFGDGVDVAAVRIPPGTSASATAAAVGRAIARPLAGEREGGR